MSSKHHHVYLGGSTVVEEAVLRITNHDPSSNISIECTYQKTRALWVDCPPTMVAPGAVLEVIIHIDRLFYIFVIHINVPIPILKLSIPSSI